jgi:hypothetical protein
MDDLLEKSKENLREIRNKLLAETDWWAVQDRTMTQEERDYRQALRDLTEQPDFPLSADFPNKP